MGGPPRSLTTDHLFHLVGFVQQIYWMHDAGGRRRTPQSGANLHQAARIPRRDEVGPGRRDVAQLRRKYGIRRIRLNEIVNARGAAAVFRALEWNKFELWNRAEHGEWCRGDALRVQQMTWRIIRNSHRHRSTNHGARGDEQLADVADAGRAFGCPSGPLVVTAEQVLILLHHRAATGRICADILGVRALEGGDVRSRQRTSRIEVASVCV